MEYETSEIKNGVAAVIITYNGDDDLIENMTALLSQCEKVIIVDNNSTVDLSMEFEFARKNGIEIIKNSENLGVATALNIGVRRVIELGFKYYMTMDQDSVLCDGCVQKLLDVLTSSDKIGSVFPSFKSLREKRKKTSSFFSLIRCLTSGNLVKTEVYERVGGYEDAFFIDTIDHDFNFKTRLAGFKVLKANNAFMKHKLGNVTIGRFGKKLYYTPSVSRYYYIGRNHRYECRKYFFRFPITILAFWFFSTRENMRFMFFSKDSRAMRQELRRGKKDYKMLAKQIKENEKNRRK